MIINDPFRSERKLSQVGYYRLSGFSYPCRIIERDPTTNEAILNPQTGRPQRLDQFMPETAFDAIFSLYLFDKKLRLLCNYSACLRQIGSRQIPERFKCQPVTSFHHRVGCGSRTFYRREDHRPRKLTMATSLSS
ncbi:Abi family protein [Desulfoluna sp.]|uniref:Abi family protein n=1 Tax=Desulfoluna sp. TaxID=2045199 RepID=UPI00345969D0